ncbi:RNA polymerase sigma-70 factor [Flagellimonas olearia]|uniref:RNA polymerase sigma-70 factor n=1 Tax=Flagellimonas olearia TaxID=552546 RepID=A0A6I1E362_9FLAO|nr:RNA polymerase sigma-70 factor [Allomuricauda olearia]KAB7530381.1 RNA polymerase sigma-70 factor [Allomuricauda olearia]
MSKEKQIDKSHFIYLLEKGKGIAFEALYRLYYDKLVHIAKGYLMYHDEAEEVVQKVFIKVWERRSKLKSVENINNYLYSMTKNSCLDTLKHQKVKNTYINTTIKETKWMVNHQFVMDETASAMIEKELENRIMDSIDLLPKACKKVFIKSRFEGMKNIEIAKELGISKRTVDNQISKALKHMRLQLKDYLTSFL